MKPLSMLALSAVTIGILAGSMSAPAEAGRKRCVFMAHNPWNGHMVADGWAKAARSSWACNRAKRRCKRELNRKRRNGAVANDCRKISNLSD